MKYNFIIQQKSHSLEIRIILVLSTRLLEYIINIKKKHYKVVEPYQTSMTWFFINDKKQGEWGGNLFLKTESGMKLTDLLK